eukprot:35129_1
MAHSIKDLLCEYVCKAQSTKDIIPLFRLIPLEAIQDAILQAIRGLDTDTVNDMQYCECLSMTHILPVDIIQHTLSFTDCLDMKYINTAFNECYNKNKALELTQRQSIIDKHEFTHNVTHEEDNTIWIMHPTRTQLNTDEIANGFEGPLNTFKDVVDAVDYGDKLLFCDGNYVMSARTTDDDENEDEFEIFETYDLQLIGVGDNACIKIRRRPSWSQLYLSNLYFKNIKLEMDSNVFVNNSLYMEDCEVVVRYRYIEVGELGSFNAKNCVFSDGPIRIHYSSSIEIIGCTFTHQEETCISLFDLCHHCYGRYFDEDDDNPSVTEFKCIANIFKDNLGYPIAIDKSAPLNIKQTLKSVIAHNILAGYNGINEEDAVDTANKIYSL